jgi:hypothetical protein
MTEIKGFYLVEEKIPSGSGNLLKSWMEMDPVQIRIRRPRQSKLGDFRSAHNGVSSRITINSNLHSVEFLITLAHEFAHAENFRVHGRKVKPHGIEWKSFFRGKLSEIITSELLDKKFENAIINCYFKRERIASSSCLVLRKLYDEEEGILPALRLEDIPVGSIFKTSSGRMLKKGNKIRTRYKCWDIRIKRYYTVHPMAEIVEFKPQEL